MSPLMKIATGSIVVGIVVLALKTLAWWMTGSIALLSDALESTVNVATAIAALIAIRLASRPADANHPYGHHKAELFSAILEGVMIIIAALLIMREAYHGFLAPRMLDAPLEGLLVNGLASVINAFWCWMLITQGRKRRSPALVADGRHLFTDVISSVGVTFGVLVAILSGWAMLDPLMALIVAINILWSGWRVMRESLSGLLDEAIPDVTLAQVRETISREAEGAVEAHDLRTRHAGQASFVEFHLIVPGEMTVNAAHDICDRIEAALKEILEGCVVTIHVEPERKAKHSGVVVL
ncbi:cation diffusion facilitator family transporter [Marinibacterium profundimaris]|uniref:Protein p34 n=1 Tax=Marinibacterium profundimaris TaxID=1679460 RepID=A0A225NGD9_9RHOB|nr:cation diffusion facilitator family transporter [Marinibacterium profundimaris]MAQ85797.1 cation transporter [Maritimibacter sp.]OWU69138.1 cadmium transporter [Marinibacterium profundimaris]